MLYSSVVSSRIFVAGGSPFPLIPDTCASNGYAVQAGYPQYPAPAASEGGR